MKRILLIIFLNINFIQAAEVKQQSEANIGLEGFNMNDEESFTLKTFRQLIDEQQQKGKSYILAKVTSLNVTRDADGKEHSSFYLYYFDALSFNEYFFGNKVNFLAKESIINFYKQLITFPKITKNKLDQLAVGIGLKINRFKDILGFPIVKVEYYEIKPDNSFKEVTTLSELIDSAEDRHKFSYLIAENYLAGKDIISSKYFTDLLLGIAYLYGISVQKNPELAKHYLELVSKQNSILNVKITGTFYLGVLYTNLADYSKARSFLELVSNQNIDPVHKAQANFGLANQYHHARGVDQDLQKARHYYGLAFNQEANPIAKADAERSLRLLNQ